MVYHINDKNYSSAGETVLKIFIFCYCMKMSKQHWIPPEKKLHFPPTDLIYTRIIEKNGDLCLFPWALIPVTVLLNKRARALNYHKFRLCFVPRDKNLFF